jgi:hypothetical protein
MEDKMGVDRKRVVCFKAYDRLHGDISKKGQIHEEPSTFFLARISI